jgi:hypothetical protein
MNCTRYRKWVKRAALSSLGASRQAKLDAHLSECAECRGLLGTEQRLAEAINLGLTASVSGLPSQDFTARIRIRLAEESERAQPRLAWVRSVWIPASVAAVVALATFLAMIRPALRQRKQSQTVRQTTRVSAPGTPSPTIDLPSVATGNTGALLDSGPARARMRSAIATPERARTRHSARAEDNAPQFQVMVEPGLWNAIVVAYRAAQSAHVDTHALAQTSDQEEQPVEMKPIEIKPVAIAELYPYTPAVPGGR